MGFKYDAIRNFSALHKLTCFLGRGRDSKTSSIFCFLARSQNICIRSSYAVPSRTAEIHCIHFTELLVLSRSRWKQWSDGEMTGCIVLLTATLPYINLFLWFYFPSFLQKQSRSFAEDGRNTNNLVIWSGFFLSRRAVAAQEFQNLTDLWESFFHFFFHK